MKLILISLISLACVQLFLSFQSRRKPGTKCTLAPCPCVPPEPKSAEDIRKEFKDGLARQERNEIWRRRLLKRRAKLLMEQMEQPSTVRATGVVSEEDLAEYEKLFNASVKKGKRKNKKRSIS